MILTLIKPFQSTLPRRSDAYNGRQVKLKWISIHAPAKERQDIKKRQNILVDFNPRSREGATKMDGNYSNAPEISIHAPAKERLIIFLAWVQVQSFQSTLPRRSDAKWSVNRQILKLFQSTLPRRSDASTLTALSDYIISIHAPAKERRSSGFFTFLSSNFNPRSREGATLNALR